MSHKVNSSDCCCKLPASKLEEKKNSKQFGHLDEWHVCQTSSSKLATQAYSLTTYQLNISFYKRAKWAKIFSSI